MNNRRIWTSALLLAIFSMTCLPVSADSSSSLASSAARYKLPWTGGDRYPVTQDWNKHFDFRLPAGTQVRAARGGTVYVKRASVDRGCCDPSCSVYDNVVRITHDDGSYGFYQHLKYGSITVNTGDVVAQGDCLGLSGATGYVCGLTGQHLHFNVNTDPFNSGGVPYGSAFIEVAFVEGAIPTGDKLSPYSQNSTAPCASPPAPTASLTPTGTPTATPGHTPTHTLTLEPDGPTPTAVGIYLPLIVRDGNGDGME